MTGKPPYTPTRTCPHRWCKALHIAPTPFVLAVLAFYLWNNLLWLLIIAIVATASFWTSKIVHFTPRPRSGQVRFRDVVQDIKESKNPIDLEMEDAKYAGTGWRVLEVRKGWARVAISCDIALLLNVGLVSVAVFSAPGEAAVGVQESTSEPLTYLSVVIGIAFFAFNMYAHKKATQPRKPKRAWLPAFLRTDV